MESKGKRILWGAAVFVIFLVFALGVRAATSAHLFAQRRYDIVVGRRNTRRAPRSV